MERNKSEIKISPSDSSFDNHGSFQKRFKTSICPSVKKRISTIIPLRKHYNHFLTFSTTELEDNSGKLYSKHLDNGKA